MKNFVMIMMLLPVLLFGDGNLQRLGLLPASFTLDKIGTSSKKVKSFCADGDTRYGPSRDIYHHFQSPDLLDVKVDGKPFEGGIEKLLKDGDITIETDGHTEVIFKLSSKSPYKTVSITVKETTIISNQKEDFELEKAWVNKLNSLKILLNDNSITFAEAKSSIKSFQKKAGLEVSGLMDSRTQDIIAKYSILKDGLIKYGYLKSDFKSFDEFLVAKVKADKVKEEWESIRKQSESILSGKWNDDLSQYEYIVDNNGIIEKWIYDDVFSKSKLTESEYSKFNEYKLLRQMNCTETSFEEVNINTFQYLFPNITWKELDDILTKIERLNQDKTANHFLIQKSSNGDYLLFNKKGEPLFRGNDELELVRILDKLNPLKTGKKSNLYLNGFESIRKEKAFFSTLRMNTRNIEALETYQNLENGTNNLYFFSNRYQHRLVEKLKNKDIMLSKYNGQTYYKTQFEMKSTANNLSILMEEQVKITALGKTRKTLKNLTRRLNKTLKDPITQISLFMYFRNLKAQLKSADDLPIATNDDLILLLGAQVERLRIVKLEGENEFLIVSN